MQFQTQGFFILKWLGEDFDFNQKGWNSFFERRGHPDSTGNIIIKR